MNSDFHERYSRQILFREIGEAGQRRLLNSSAVLVGCGALGTAQAALLVRAGLGRLRIIDRDFVEPSNLHRQTLFDEADARDALPKAVAAERKLHALNSGVAVEGVVADLTPSNAKEFLKGFPLILDGTDNFETRFLLNDVAIQTCVPWIYSAVVASYGVTFTIRPDITACFACLLEAGAVGAEETCDTAGVLNSAAQLVASLAATEATKLLLGRGDALDDRLRAIDVWSGRWQAIHVARNRDCRVCVRREFSWLGGKAQPTVTMCGRDSVQIHERSRQLNLRLLAARLEGVAEDVRSNEYLLRFRIPPHEITVFPDGRAVIKGTRDTAVARSLYARFIGS
jgi:adenylyltransferase/sulfurtransferase